MEGAFVLHQLVKADPGYEVSMQNIQHNVLLL